MLAIGFISSKSFWKILNSNSIEVAHAFLTIQGGSSAARHSGRCIVGRLARLRDAAPSDRATRPWEGPFAQWFCQLAQVSISMAKFVRELDRPYCTGNLYGHLFKHTNINYLRIIAILQTININPVLPKVRIVKFT